MKKLVIFLVIVGAAYFMFFKGKKAEAGNPVKPLYDTPYIVLYSNLSCSIYKSYCRLLDDKQIQFEFKNIDKAGVNEELWKRMQLAGISTEEVNYPVVEINTRFFQRPLNEAILKVYNEEWDKYEASHPQKNEAGKNQWANGDGATKYGNLDEREREEWLKTSSAAKYGNLNEKRNG